MKTFLFKRERLNILNFFTETIFNPYLIGFSYPKNPKMCDPILVTLFKMQLHSSQSSRENATPSSGISPLVSYKEVPPPPPPPVNCVDVISYPDLPRSGGDRGTRLVLTFNFDLGHEGKCLNLLNEVFLLFGNGEAFGLVVSVSIRPQVQRKLMHV